MSARASQARRALGSRDVTVVGVMDPRVPPVMVNPFEPEPGFPVQAHIVRLADLLEAVFRPPGLVGQVIRGGLLRAYADCGWDTVTGATPPGVRTPPAVPSFTQLRQATLGAAQALGCDHRLLATVRAFLQARLEAMWTSPAGRFLEGGHPADVGGLLQGKVLLAGDGLTGDEAGSFLAGVVMARIAERLHVRGPLPSRFALMLASGDHPPEAGRWFDRLGQEMRPYGPDVITVKLAWPGRAVATLADSPAGPPPAAVLRGRRSAACGARCRGQGPCTGYELHAAGLLSRDDEQAWLRIWAQALLLAFVAGRPLPGLPGEVLACWRALPARQRGCVLASILDRAVSARAAALRPYYDPGALMSVVAATAARMLARTAAPFRAGPVWVIPPLRWLHEIERLHPPGGTGIRPDDIAPPLDFGLAGLPDWPGIRIRDRLTALGRHPLSMALPRNRRLAATALLGQDGRGSLDADLAAAAVGIHPAGRLAYAARLMGTGASGPEPGWLEVVLSWPDRITHSDLCPTATR
jgi:hypothetical protein